MRERVFEALGGDDVEEDGEGKIRWHGRVSGYLSSAVGILNKANVW